MSTSDQQGQGPLTRKQLREIRLTGSTPVITEEEAAAAAAPPAPPLPRAAEPVEIPPAPVAEADADGAPLTRRQAREKERVRTASFPVIDDDVAAADDDAPSVEEPPVAEPVIASDEVPSKAPAEQVPAVVTEVPRFPASPAAKTAPETSVATTDVPEKPAEPAPVAPEPADEEPADEVPADEVPADEAPIEMDVPAEAEDEQPDAAAALGLNAPDEIEPVVEPEPAVVDEAPAAGDDASVDGRPTVSASFGRAVRETDAVTPAAPSFDDLLSSAESGGSAHSASNALIFTPSPGEGSLSGPVASTGEVLITGSYELPQGLGSQGHAHGTADGKDVDAVLIDGELPPASSPTPIAASAAVSTSKSAGEVIRPPAPDKGNKLMLALAITAGGLALAVAVALVIAFTTNVL